MSDISLPVTIDHDFNSLPIGKLTFADLYKAKTVYELLKKGKASFVVDSVKTKDGEKFVGVSVITQGDSPKEALEGMLYQFAYRNDGHGKNPPSLFTGGLSALEDSFSALGWPDPKPCPDMSCDIQGCQRWTCCGVPIPNGDYYQLCSEHYRLIEKGTELKKKRGRGYNAKDRKKRLRGEYV